MLPRGATAGEKALIRTFTFQPDGTSKAVPLPLKTIESLGATLVEEYQTQAVIDLGKASIEELAKATGLPIEPLPDHDKIFLHAYTLDASGGLPLGVTAPALPAKTPGLYLVVFRSLPKPEWFEALAKVATSVIAYVTSNTYLVYAPLASLQQLDAESAPVINILPFAPAFKLLDLDTLAKDDPQPPVIVNVANVAGAESVRSLLRSMVPPDSYGEVALPTITLVATRIPSGDIDGLATHPEVVSIEPMGELTLSSERQALTVAGQEAQGGPPFVPSCSANYYNWLSTMLPSGTSSIHIGILDTGLDTGTHGGTNIHPDFKKSNGDSRVYANIALTGNPSTQPLDCEGHGTLVAAVAAGSGGKHSYSTQYGEKYSPCSTPWSTCTAESGCFWADAGITPEATISSLRIYDDDPNPNDMQNFFTNNEAIFENLATWGVWVANLSSNEKDHSDYTSLTAALDYKVRRAHASAYGGPDQWKPIAIVVSAGNNDQSVDHHVLAPATGKNVIAVGASESMNPYNPNNQDCSAAGSYDSTHDIAPFSTEGKFAADGRVKPDLVAPGTQVTGALTREQWLGRVPPCWGNELCRRAQDEGALWGTRPNDGIGWAEGTSFSAPTVSGAVGLMSLWWWSWPGHTAQASPAMAKAMLLTSALDLKGGARVETDGIPSDKQGWGKVDLRDGFPPPLRRFGLDQSYVFYSATDPSWPGTFRVHLPQGVANPKVDVTLVWTDANGERVSGYALKNNLDLTITVAAGSYRGNAFDGETGFSKLNPTDPWDTRNNVERARFAAAEGSTFGVIVTPANINWRAVPSDTSHPFSQDFALYVKNACKIGDAGCT